MTHCMNLWDDSFQAIKEGWKIVEMRLNDEKRSIIDVDDIIEFTNTTTQEKMSCKVMNIYKYSDFAELYKHHDKISIGYKEDETANPDDMYAYYTREQVEKYGVVGIQVSVIEDSAIKLFSDRYEVKKLYESDVPDILALCKENTLYYQYCPPFVSEESICEDMNALPPGKQMDDKHYIGFYNNKDLIAVMDLIERFPDENTTFIGFFMTDVSIQKHGVGTKIITELCEKLKCKGYSSVRLGWVKGNPQAEHFWKKNGFAETGVESKTENYIVTIAQRVL